MFEGVDACLEGYLPEEAREIASLLQQNGGSVADMLTSKTTHLLVNENRQRGFLETKCAAESQPVWILSGSFVTTSLQVGMQLPELQFLCRRTGDQQSLPPPLDTQNEHNATEDPSETEQTKLSEITQVNPDLQEFFETAEGGQLWGTIDIEDNDSDFVIRYLLGGVPSPSTTDKPTKVVEKEKSLEKRKRTRAIKRKKLVRTEGNKRPTGRVSRPPPLSTRRLAKQAKQTKNQNSLSDSQESGELEEEEEEEVTRSDEELFISAAPWKQSTVMVSQDGKIWLRGRSDGEPPFPLSISFPFPVCHVVCGKAHVLALTTAGQVYSWGSSHTGQLGHGNLQSLSQPTRITRVLGNVPVQQITASGDSSGALTCMGGVFMWGSNQDGKLGSTSQRPVTLPILVQFPERCEISTDPLVGLVVGVTHSMAWTRSGALFSWGSNRYGQLGQGSEKVWDHLPNRVSLSFPVEDADCGLFHSAALCRDGTVYTWGLSRNGALGRAVASMSSSDGDGHELPGLVDSFVREGLEIRSVRCGDHMTCCLTADEGEVFLFGRLKSNHSPLWTPTPLPEVRWVTDIYCNHSRLCFLVHNTDVLLQRHCIEGNLDPLQALLNFLCSEDRRLARHLHEIQDNEMCNLLHHACRHNQAKVVEFLLCRFPSFDPNMTNLAGYAPIHVCAAHNHADALAQLLLHPAIDINATNGEGDTALHISVKEASREVMRLLVYHGADKSLHNDSGDTPLHIAVKDPNGLRAAYFLVCHAAPVSEKDAVQLNPLEYCSWEDRDQLKRQAEVNEVFISYAHVDQPFAIRVRKALNCYSLRCWMDDWRLEAGGDWRTAIGEGLMHAKIVVFIASRKSVLSDWCLKELYLAEELGKRIICVIQEDISDCEPLLDVRVATLLSHVRSKDIFDFLDHTRFTDHAERLARRLYGVLNATVTRLPAKVAESSRRVKELEICPQKLIEKQELYICWGSCAVDATTIDWLQSRCRDNRLQYVDLNPIESKEEEQAIVENCWVYVLIVSPEIFTSQRVLQQLRWIEKANRRVNLLLLYFDPAADLVDMFPTNLFTEDQLKEIAMLSSFCTSDSTWMSQLMYTLNWLRKSALLDRHIELLSKRVAQAEGEKLLSHALPIVQMPQSFTSQVVV